MPAAAGKAVKKAAPKRAGRGFVLKTGVRKNTKVDPQKILAAVYLIRHGFKGEVLKSTGTKGVFIISEGRRVVVSENARSMPVVTIEPALAAKIIVTSAKASGDKTSQTSVSLPIRPNVKKSAASQ